MTKSEIVNEMEIIRQLCIMLMFLKNCDLNRDYAIFWQKSRFFEDFDYIWDFSKI